MQSLEPQLLDAYGRIATNLRISVTDRCNLRCIYCFKTEKVNWLKRDELLNFQEIKRIAQIASELGVNQLRITGGEPLVRPGVNDLIKELHSIRGIKRISMTTNGVLLNDYIGELEKSGLSSINISLDTLNADRFSQITKQNYFNDVLSSILKAKNSKLIVKVNIVPIKGFNDKEILDFVNFAIKHDLTIRFIEFMPFKGNNWSKDNLISANRVKTDISNKYDLIPIPQEHPSQTSRVFKINGFKGRIGFIASVTKSFCQLCNRLRLTADGNLRSCLNNKNETPIRVLLRSGISDKKLKEIMIKTVRMKQKEHENFLSSEYQPPYDDREMIRIGG